MREETGLNLVAVFVPSSPMPMTGYTIFVEANRLIPLPISVDEALRVTVSGGVLIPPGEAAPEGEDDDLLRDALHAQAHQLVAKRDGVADTAPNRASNQGSKDEDA